MEDLLTVYSWPYNPQKPVVGFDETSKQLLADARPGMPARPGHLAKRDYEYQRRGTRNIFMMVEPKGNKRYVRVTAHRRKPDFAYCMKWLVEEIYPESDMVLVVLDNLNTHFPSSLYETFNRKQADKILDRLEFHYTPKHASWLNVAEIEIGILNRQCLNRRIESEELLLGEAKAWEVERNRKGIGIKWKFSVSDAKRVFPALYPSELSG